MKIEVGRQDITVRLVGRMLNRGKVINVVIRRDNDHAARMLTGRPFDAFASFGKPQLLCLMGNLSAFLQIVQCVTKRRLLRNGRNRSRFKDVVRTEQLFGVPVDIRLIFTGKVQVDIRLLVAVESQEGFERDIVSVLVHPGAAFRAVFCRKVESRTAAAVGDKLAVFALGAYIVRYQRINLRNTGHMRDKRRTDRTTRTDQIAMLFGIINQFLCNHVQNRESVADNRIQFPFQPLCDQFRHRITVNFLCTCPGNPLQILFRPSDAGRIGPFRNRTDIILDHIGDLVGVGDNHLICFIGAKIGKLIQHLIGRAEIERRLIVGVLKFHTGQQDGAEDRVFRLHKMHVTGCNNWFIELFTNPKDGFIVFNQLIAVLRPAGLNHKFIVAQRLDFQIIIKGCNVAQLFKRFPLDNRLEQFPCFTGTADQQPFPVFHNLTLWGAGPAVIILNMCAGNQFIQVFQSD